LPSPLVYLLGVAGLAGLIWGAYSYAGNSEDGYMVSL